MNKFIALGIAVALMATAIPGVEAENRTETTQYIPGTSVWCSADEHSLIPTHDPDTDDPESLPGWAISGEPECVYADAINAVNEATGNERFSVGLGAAAWTLQPSDLGGLLTSTTEDDLFGSNSAYQYVSAASAEGDAAISEGCGAQTITLPLDPPVHWQADPEDPYYLAWSQIDAAGVDEDLSVCFSSAGFVTAEFIS